MGDEEVGLVREALMHYLGKASGVTEDLFASSKTNRDAVGDTVRQEVERALARLGLATAEEVAELRERVDELERTLALRPAAAEAAPGGERETPETPETGPRADQAPEQGTPPPKKAAKKAAKSASKTAAKSAGKSAPAAPKSTPATRAAAASTHAPEAHRAKRTAPRPEDRP